MDEEKVKGRILDRTEERIFSEGLVTLTMDDVASDAGVSKKTLYRLVPSKSDLILMVVNRRIDGVERKQRAILEDPNLDFREKVDGLIRVVTKVLVQIGSKGVRDLIKQTLDVWEAIRRRRLGMMKRMLILLEEGRREGQVRGDIPTDFIAAYFLKTVDAMITPQTVVDMNMTPKDLVDCMLKIFFDGVLSERGKKKGGEDRK